MGALKAADEIARFLYDDLLATVTGVDCPQSLNVPRVFRDRLTAQTRTAFRADELVERWRPQLDERLERHLQTAWDGLGVPRPLAIVNDDGTAVTWKHDHYRELSGLEPLSPGFFEVFTWLNGLGSFDFLFPCVVYLVQLGASPVFVTDGSRDAGVDCIGLIRDGMLRSVTVIVQAKTSTSLIEKELVLSEYGKWQMLPLTERYREYRRILGLDVLCDGNSTIYVLAANKEFKDPAREAARGLGVLLRSIKQLALWFSKAGLSAVLPARLGAFRDTVKHADAFTDVAPFIRDNVLAS